MKAVQVQIEQLNQKIDQLQQMVEQINSQIGILKEEKIGPMLEIPKVEREILVGGSVSEHKDILQDEREVDIFPKVTTKLEISAETQILRLTAQLTAAYNRIAALEEQLFVCRRPS
jgi:molybdopterin converting factor small subunit